MTAQPMALFEDVTGAGRSHWNDPETSRTAAAEDRSPLRRKVLAAFQNDHAGYGYTDDELAQAAQIRHRHSAATRRKELSERGWPIVDSGRRRPTPDGNPSIVWVLRP